MDDSRTASIALILLFLMAIVCACVADVPLALVSRKGAQLSAPEAPPVADGSFPAFNALPGPAGVDLSSFAAYSPPIDTNTSTAVVAMYETDVPASRTMTMTSEEAITNLVVYGNGQTNNQAMSMYASVGYGHVKMPAGNGDGTRICWPDYGNATGAPFRVGHPELHWIGPSQVTTNDQIVLHGKNLMHDGSGYLYVNTVGMLSTTNGNKYRAVFDLPGGMTNGVYTAWAFNGTGRDYGWSAPKTFKVASAIDYSGNTYNVTGGSFSDFTTKLYAAAAGSTVNVPDGSYAVTAEVDGTQIASNVLINCNSTNAVFTVDATFSDSYAFDLAGTVGLTISNLNLNGGDGTPHADRLINLSGNNCKLSGCRITQEDYTSAPGSGELAHISGAQYGPVVIENSVFVGSRRISIGSYVDYRNNENYGLWGDIAIFKSTGMSETEITGCTFQHWNWSGGTQLDGAFDGRVFVAQVSPVYYMSYHDNETINLKAPNVDQHRNASETILQENTYPRITEAVTSATSNTLVGAYMQTDSCSGCIITIVDGPGMGQSFPITSVDTGTGTATIDGQWRVVPTSSSVYVVQKSGWRWSVTDNIFDGIDDGVNTASAAVSLYGGGLEMTVANNVANEIEDGFIVWGFVDDKDVTGNYYIEPSYFNLFSSNSVVNPSWHVDSFGEGGMCYTVTKYYNAGRTPLANTNVYAAVLGTTFRDSTVTGAAYGPMFNGSNSDYTVDATIFEYISGSATNVYTAGGVNTETNNLSITTL